MPDKVLEEEALVGGFVTPVVRIGDTVHRQAGDWTPTIHRLLTHVRAKGVLWTPTPLGFDALGREVLSFIAGDVPHDLPDWIWSEQVLCDVARALCQWHEATRDFPLAEARWNFVAPGPLEVICHNDFAPYNCVFRDARLVGVIDFDLCAPGSRLWDLAYTAYRYVPLLPGPEVAAAGSEKSPFTSAVTLERIQTLLKAYGAAANITPAALVAATIDRLHALAAWTEAHVRQHGVAELAQHPALYRGHASWLQAWRNDFT